jgi:TatD DNase family protein
MPASSCGKLERRKMLIDAHSHVDRYELEGEHALQSALAQMAEHKILTISNSMDLASYRRNLEISEACDWVLPAFGVHPWNAAEYADRLPDLVRAIEQAAIIGEIGLDHYFVKDAITYPDQRKVFEYFLSAARDQQKIVNLHTKGAEKEVLELLERYSLQRVIVHWYSGPLDIFRQLLPQGAYFTVGLEVRFSKHIQTIAQEIPLGQLLTETDNPGGPRGFTGELGMPVLVKDVVQGIADAKRTTAQAIVQAVQANLLELVRDDPGLAEKCAKLLLE